MEIFIDTWVSIHRNISFFCHPRGTGNNVNLKAVSIPGTKSFLSNASPQKMEPLSSDQLLTLGLGQEINKMSLEYLAVPESKEVIRRKEGRMEGRQGRRERRREGGRN